MAPIRLEGLFRFEGQHDLELDDDTAKNLGQVNSGGRVAPHGTFPWIRLFWVRTMKVDGVDAVLEIYDDAGNFAHFDRADELWTYRSDPKVFTVKAGTYVFPRKGQTSTRTVTLSKDISLTRYPSLVLSKYGPRAKPSYVDLDVYVLAIPGVGSQPGSSTKVAQWILPGDDDGAFTWRSSDARLPFKRVDPEAPFRGDATFGQLFQNTPITKLDYSWSGFDARHLQVIPDENRGFLSSPGTPSLNDAFDGAHVFEYPAPDSKNFIRASGVTDEPPIPFGVRAQEINVADEASHTSTISSGVDGARAWATTLGLSGGVEDLISLSVKSSYRREFETQRSSERRYALTRKRNVWLKLVTDLAQMTLSNDFLDTVQQVLKEQLVKSNAPDWELFVSKFGTHYAHGITHGEMTMMQTKFSLSAESYMKKYKKDIEAEASATVKGIKVGASASHAKEWSEKTDTQVSAEDVHSFTVGVPHKSVIALDLRPLPELFTPLLVRYNPADDWGQFAPWIWYVLRPSLVQYLSDAQSKQLGGDLLVDYTPALASANVRITFDRGPLGPSRFAVTGSVKCTALHESRQPLGAGLPVPDAPFDFLENNDIVLENVLLTDRHGQPLMPKDQPVCKFWVRKSSRLSPKLRVAVDLCLLHEWSGMWVPSARLSVTKDLLLDDKTQGSLGRARGWTLPFSADNKGIKVSASVTVIDHGSSGDEQEF